MSTRNIRLSVLAVLLSALAGAVTAHAYDAHKGSDQAQAVPPAQKVSPAPWVSQARLQGDPWAAMAQQMRQMQQMQADMDRIFNGAFASVGSGPGFGTASMFGQIPQATTSGITQVKIAQKGKNYVVTARLPGSKGKNVQVDLKGRLLSISSLSTGSEKKTSGKGQVISQAQYSTSSEQAFTLPGPVDSTGMTTSFKDGLLTVTIPKATS